MVCNNFIMSVTICIKSTNYACQGSRGCWWLDTCKESWTNLTEDDIETWDVRYIYFFLSFLHCLLSLIRYKKHQLPYPHVTWSLRTHVTLTGSIVIEFMDCRLFIDFTDPWKVLRLGENVKMFFHTCPCLTAPDLHIHLTERLSCCQAGHQLQAPDLYLCHTVTVLFFPQTTRFHDLFLSQLVINKQGLEKRKPMTRTQM